MFQEYKLLSFLIVKKHFCKTKLYSSFKSASVRTSIFVILISSLENNYRKKDKTGIIKHEIFDKDLQMSKIRLFLPNKII